MIASQRRWWTLASENMPPERGHIPVLTKELLQYLQPRPGGTYVDGTVGAAGHSLAILEAVQGQARLIGLDRDRQALTVAARNLAKFGAAVTLVHSDFRHLPAVLQQHGVDRVDGIVLDLGVSSLQLDQVERGFSFHHDAPLDMRMDRDQPTTAADLVNQLEEKQLASILWEFGEERWSRRIAAAIVRERRKHPIKTTLQLAELVKNAIPAAARRTGGHPARRTFQALRIAVNDELNSLKEVLTPAVEMLKCGGRIIVISFHSLEDRIVKHTFRRLATECVCEPGANCRCGNRKLLKILTKRPVTPDPDEVARNPRARSAKLRAAERLCGHHPGAYIRGHEGE